MNKTGEFLPSIKKEVATMIPYITANICYINYWSATMSKQIRSRIGCHQSYEDQT